MHRRALLAGAVGAIAAPYLVPGRALGTGGATAPSERLTLGVFGYGNRCRHVLGHFMTFDDVQAVAVCDVQRQRLEGGRAAVNKRYGNNDCRGYDDFRELLARDDIDTVLLATGDRWHTLGSLHAAKAGKDMYCEKPISLTIAEGRALTDTLARLGTIYQAGHQRRSTDSYKFQREVVQRGMIGELKQIVMQVWRDAAIPPEAPRPVPDGFDYDMWLGPTPWHPYTNGRVRGWNYFWDTGAGAVIGMGCHYTDLAQFGKGSDDTMPVEYDGKAVFPAGAMSTTPVECFVRTRYADGVELILQQRGAFADRFLRFIGTKGWIQVDDHTNRVTAKPASILKMRGISARSWANPGDHVRNFLDSVKTRRPTVCPPLIAHRATAICHAMNISMRLGRPLKWDPKAERFLGDDEANRMISRAMRPPWHL
jgi:predicted dehydrogenase